MTDDLDIGPPEEFVRNDLRAVNTCRCAPEQYSVFCGEEHAGFLRLSYGYFSVQCPDVGGEIVYEAEPLGDGMFYDEEREGYLNKALEAIEKWLSQKKSSGSELTVS